MSIATPTAWTDEDFDKKGMKTALRRLYSKVRTEAFFARRDAAPKSIGYLRIQLAALDAQGPEPVWDRMHEGYERIIREYDERVANLHTRIKEHISEGEAVVDFVARGEQA